MQVWCPAGAELPPLFTAVARAATTSNPDNPAVLVDEFVSLIDLSLVENSSETGRRWREVGGVPLVCKPVETGDDDKDATIARLEVDVACLVDWQRNL